MITLIQAGQAADRASVLTLTNELDPRTASLEGVDRVELQFPKFSDGRAYSQAVILRKRMGFRGDIRATGDVLIDQLVHMERTGFTSAVLKDDKDPADAQRQFARFAGFYQGDVVTRHPLFARG